MTKSVCCDYGKMFFIYNLFYRNFLQVFSIKFSVNLSSRHLVYFSGTTMVIRVTRPFIVSFFPGDQYGGPDCFRSCLHALFTEINQKSNQIKSTKYKIDNKIAKIKQVFDLLFYFIYKKFALVIIQRFMFFYVLITDFFCIVIRFITWNYKVNNVK